MRVGIIQSNYIPWRGYLDFIDDVDLFILFDDVQYTDRDWRNRNRIKTPNGPTWLSVSLERGPRSQLVQDVTIDWDVDWHGRHLQLLRQNYSHAPFFTEVFPEFEALLEQRPMHLSKLNRALLEWAMTRCGITTPLLDAAPLSGRGQKTERLISLVRAVGGDTYLSGPAAESYIDGRAFEAAGIGLEYKSYDYKPYPQLWGDFEGAVSFLDLFMNTGQDARSHIKSRSPNRIVSGRA